MLIVDMPMPKFCIWRDDKNEPHRCPLLNEDDDCVLQDSNIYMGWNEQYAHCPIKGELVRCRECKHFVENTWECSRLCDRFGDEYSDARVYPDWFCADGERKEGAE